MEYVEAGDMVRIHYEGRLDDGTVFASSTEGEPASVRVGTQVLIPAFDQALIGMRAGESKTLSVAVVDAFGPHRHDLIRRISRQALDVEGEVRIGERLAAIDTDGESVAVTVVGLSPETLTIDGNHRLAGEDLTFDILLVEIT